MQYLNGTGLLQVEQYCNLLIFLWDFWRWIENWMAVVRRALDLTPCKINYSRWRNYKLTEIG